MSRGLRLKLAEYREDLLARVHRVACPVCKAKPGKNCLARWNGVGRPREVKWCHGWRHNEAKKLGLLKGRWYDSDGRRRPQVAYTRRV
jgi:hypothetical protein